MMAACLTAVTFAQEQQESTYDPAPFLSSMVTLRTAAETCDRFLANSPDDRTRPILEFFKLLNQDLPVLVDDATQASLDKFVASQAAVLCREKLDAAFGGYRAQAETYLASKPEGWPAPPEVTSAPWCNSENCLEF